MPPKFRQCNKHKELCIACRIFGMMGRGSKAEVFLGKVNISDAVSAHVVTHPPEYTLALMNPKPHHDALYLDPTMEHIAGRKYYFHHEQPTFDSQYRYIGNNPQPINRRIHPLGVGTHFKFYIDFTNLEPEEFAALLLAIRLEPTMRHKIGYGKPMGLGSVHFEPTKLMLVDYARRYTVEGVLNGGSRSTWKGKDLRTFIDAHIAKNAPNFLMQEAMADLRRIWRWPPPVDVRYEYPGQAWFEHHSTTRIAQMS